LIHINSVKSSKDENEIKNFEYKIK